MFKRAHFLQILCLLWIILALFAQSQRIHEIAQNANTGGFSHLDYGIFYRSGQLFFEKQNIYGRVPIQCIDMHVQPPAFHILLQANGNLNPPFFNALILPLTLLSFKKSIIAWEAASLLVGMISIVLLARSYGYTNLLHPFTLSLLACLLCYFPTLANLKTAQVGLLLFAGITALWYSSRKQNDVTAGILLGLLVNIKLFVGLFIIFFILQKRWRLLASGMCIGFVCLAISTILFGKNIYFEYLTSLKQIGWYATSWNAGLYGFLIRLFGGNEANMPLFLHPVLVPILYYSCACILAALFIYLCRIKPENKLSNFDLQFSITLAIMLFISPFGWLYYFPILLIPLLTILSLDSHSPHHKLFIRTTGLALFISALPINLLHPSQQMGITTVLLWSSYSFYALALLLITLLAIAWVVKPLVVTSLDNPSAKNFLIYASILLFILAWFPHGLFGSTISHLVFGVDQSIPEFMPHCSKFLPSDFYLR